MTDILGLNPIVLSIVIVIAGVGIHNILGWIKSKDPPNPKKIAASVIIGVFTSFGVVTPILQQLSTNPGTEYVQFVTVLGAIATVAGIDQIVKNGGGAILAKAKSK
jgi:uncharacterized protein (UPF0261 family)